MNLVAKKVSTVDPPVPTYTLEGPSLEVSRAVMLISPIATGVTGTLLLLGETFGCKVWLTGRALIGAAPTARPTPTPSAAAPPVDGELSEGHQGRGQSRSGALALIGVLGATGAYTTLRAIGKRAHAMHSLVGFSAWCVIVSSVGMAATRTPFITHRWDFVLMLFAMGVFGFIAQSLLTMGLQREMAGRGTLAVYIQIVFASILERIFFHLTPSALSIVGDLISLSSALYVALTKSSAATPATAGSARGVGVEQALAIEEGRGLLSHADTDEECGFTRRSPYR
ncbi:hypothetical protein FIBSPDRAFT_1042321 [Athelia psychrophila]|uniref:Uncharacterized protein n=1 Tax=Athelia psychrophila TaxID=1759441 RepID=A0A166MSI8_9AGAM|nr:hypothetical protein FIBSPDRAFT_1042321 [Fibularhizoctonia sp. CBS 109695]